MFSRLSNRKGLTLIEIIIALALLGIISVTFITSLSAHFTFLSDARTMTQELFTAQEEIEKEIEQVKMDISNGLTPDDKVSITLFEGEPQEITVDGFYREFPIGSSRFIKTIIAENRMPAYPVPVVLSTDLNLRLSGSDLPNNYEYVLRSGLAARANSVIDDPDGVFLVNRHEWFVSRPGFSVPIVSSSYIDEDFDYGRIYPIYPYDYLPVPIKANTDMLDTSDFSSIISDYTGRHLIYTITPYAVSGKKGVTVYSEPVFLHGPTVTNGLVLHLNASMVSKDPAVSSIETSGDDIYVTQWDDLSGQNNHAYQGTTSSKPKLTEIQYKDDLYVWGKALQPNNAGTSMNIGAFNPSVFNDFTVFVVARSNASHTNTPIVSGGGGSWSFGWNEGGWLSFNASGDPAVLEGGQGLDNKLHVFSMVSSGGTSSVRINGVSGAASGTAVPVSTTPLNINWNQMDIAEILIYDRNLSSSNDLLDVETYLMNKYDPDPADVLSYIVYLKPLPSRTIVQGDSFSPPSTVEALMSNGSSQHVAVTWSGSIDTSTLGSQSITTTAVMDSSKTTNLTVNVIGIESLIPHTTDDIVLELGTPDNMPSRLEAILTDGSKRFVDVIWSSNTGDISVSETIVTGNNLGVYPNGLTATAALNPTVSIDYGVEVIGVLVTGVTVEPESLVMNINDTSQLTATVVPNDASNKEVTWSSSNELVATVDSDGLVTAISDGEATITVTTEDGGFDASSSVEVLAEPVEVVGYRAENVQTWSEPRYFLWWIIGYDYYTSADIYIILSDGTEHFHGEVQAGPNTSNYPSISRNVTGTATADTTGESVPYSLTINVNP